MADWLREAYLELTRKKPLNLRSYGPRNHILTLWIETGKRMPESGKQRLKIGKPLQGFFIFKRSWPPPSPLTGGLLTRGGPATYVMYVNCVVKIFQTHARASVAVYLWWTMPSGESWKASGRIRSTLNNLFHVSCQYHRCIR